MSGLTTLLDQAERQPVQQPVLLLRRLWAGESLSLWQSGATAAPRAGFVCVAFSPRSDLGLPPLFGLGTFEKYRLPVFYVQAHANHWYQTPEMATVCALIRQHAGANRLLAYGSSMGAFAALAYAQALGAARVLALSPQVSIAPELVGHFESRWQEIAQSLSFTQPDARSGWPAGCEAVLAYDPQHLADRTHVDMLDPPGQRRAAHLRLALAGHPVGRVMVQGSVLSTLLRQLADGALPLAECLRQARAGWRRSPARPYALAMGLQAWSRRNGRQQARAARLVQGHGVEGLGLNPASLHAKLQAQFACAHCQQQAWGALVQSRYKTLEAQPALVRLIRLAFTAGRVSDALHILAALREQRQAHPAHAAHLPPPFTAEHSAFIVRQLLRLGEQEAAAYWLKLGLAQAPADAALAALAPRLRR